MMNDAENISNNLILKQTKTRAPLQVLIAPNDEDKDNSAFLLARKRRVSFSNVNKIKEFNAGAESLLVCQTPAYEEPFCSSSDSSCPSSVMDLSNGKSFTSSINRCSFQIIDENKDLNSDIKTVQSSLSMCSNIQDVNHKKCLSNAMDLRKLRANDSQDVSENLRFNLCSNKENIVINEDLQRNMNLEYGNVNISNTAVYSTRLSLNDMEITEVIENQVNPLANCSMNMELTEALPNELLETSSCDESFTRKSDNMEITEANYYNLIHNKDSMTYLCEGVENKQKLSDLHVQNCNKISLNSIELTETVGNESLNSYKNQQSVRLLDDNMELTEVINQIPESDHITLTEINDTLATEEKAISFSHQHKSSNYSCSIMEFTEGNINFNQDNSCDSSSTTLLDSNMEFTEVLEKFPIVTNSTNNIEFTEAVDKLPDVHKSLKNTRLTESVDTCSTPSTSSMEFTEVINKPLDNSMKITEIIDKLPLITESNIEFQEAVNRSLDRHSSVDSRGFKEFFDKLTPSKNSMECIVVDKFHNLNSNSTSIVETTKVFDEFPDISESNMKLTMVNDKLYNSHNSMGYEQSTDVINQSQCMSGNNMEFTEVVNELPKPTKIKMEATEIINILPHSESKRVDESLISESLECSEDINTAGFQSVNKSVSTETSMSQPFSKMELTSIFNKSTLVFNSNECIENNITGNSNVSSICAETSKGSLLTQSYKENVKNSKEEKNTVEHHMCIMPSYEEINEKPILTKHCLEELNSSVKDKNTIEIITKTPNSIDSIINKRSPTTQLCVEELNHSMKGEDKIEQCKETLNSIVTGVSKRSSPTIPWLEELKGSKKEYPIGLCTVPLNNSVVKNNVLIDDNLMETNDIVSTTKDYTENCGLQLQSLESSCEQEIVETNYSHSMLRKPFDVSNDISLNKSDNETSNFLDDMYISSSKVVEDPDSVKNIDFSNEICEKENIPNDYCNVSSLKNITFRKSYKFGVLNCTPNEIDSQYVSSNNNVKNDSGNGNKSSSIDNEVYHRQEGIEVSLKLNTSLDSTSMEENGSRIKDKQNSNGEIQLINFSNSNDCTTQSNDNNSLGNIINTSTVNVNTSSNVIGYHSNSPNESLLMEEKMKLNQSQSDFIYTTPNISYKSVQEQYQDKSQKRKLSYFQNESIENSLSNTSDNNEISQLNEKSCKLLCVENKSICVQETVTHVFKERLETMDIDRSNVLDSLQENQNTLTCSHKSTSLNYDMVDIEPPTTKIHANEFVNRNDRISMYMKKVPTSYLDSIDPILRKKWCLKEMKDGSLSIELFPNLLFLHMTVDSLGCISNFNYKEVISDYSKPWDKYAIYIFKKSLTVQWLESVGYSVIFINDLLSKLEFHISQASNLAEDIKYLRIYHNFKIKDNILSFDLKKYASRCWLRITIDISSTDIRHTDISTTNIIGDVKQLKIQNLFKDLPPEKYKLSSFAKQILINLTKLNRTTWNN